MPDAVVIGAGPNGLVAANLLTDAGWSVEVLEAQSEPGGAVRSDRGVHPGCVSDLFSSFHPLAAASPVIAGLELHREGLRRSQAPRVLAHPTRDGRCAVPERRHPDTAAGLDALTAGDGRSWLDLYDVWDRLGPSGLRHHRRSLHTSSPGPFSDPARGTAADGRRSAGGQVDGPAGATPGRGGVPG